MSGSQHKSRLLMAEDSEELLAVWRILFQSSDHYEVKCIASGKKALREMDEGYIPDVLVTDYYLGDLTGLELMSACRRYNPEAKVLVVTGNGDDERLNHMAEIGEIELLVKPVKFQSLKEKVDQMITGLDIPAPPANEVIPSL